MNRLTVEECHRLIRNGILSKDDRVELLEGWIVQKKKKTPIVSTVRSLVAQQIHLLTQASDYHVSYGAVTTEDSKPEPDYQIVRGDIRSFVDHHPYPRDTPLLVEVSEGSLMEDRGIKKRIYARAGSPVYWIVNIPGRQIEVHTEPSGPCEQPDYAKVAIFMEGDIVPVVIDGKVMGQINVKDVLP